MLELLKDDCSNFTDMDCIIWLYHRLNSYQLAAKLTYFLLQLSPYSINWLLYKWEWNEDGNRIFVGTGRDGDNFCRDGETE